MTPYKLQDSLTQQLVELRPLQSSEVRIYLCGPTVYDEPHIGHLRSAYIFDVIRRILSDQYKVMLVRNVTDVDDKIIDRAKLEGRSSESLAEEQYQLYQRNLIDFGVKAIDFEPRATEHIVQMIEMISTLIKKEFAYISGHSVYFAVRKFTDYGRLSGQNIDQMLDQSPCDVGEEKKESLDFALWKAAKEGEPYWDSPWGKGRPGWHIECSAMSAEYCGKSFDIHGGGKDLIFPHHENERAQSMACNGSFAKYWVHHGLITINSRKMSKSVGNFITLKNIQEKVSAEALKMFFLQSHYTSDADFTWEKINGLENSLRSFRLAFEGLDVKDNDINLSEPFYIRFQEALHNDFNTPGAIAVLYDAFHEANKIHPSNPKHSKALMNFVRFCFRKYFGMFIANLQKNLMSDPIIVKLLKTREHLRTKKKYALSDALRDGILKSGLMIEDQGGTSVIKDPDAKMNAELILTFEKLLDEIASLESSQEKR